MYDLNPYDSDTFPDPDHFDESMPEIDPTIPNPFDNVPFPYLSNISDSSSSDSDPHIATDPSEPAIHMTDLKNIRTFIGAITKYPGGNLSNYLKEVPGLIILPLSAVSMLRKPSGHHTANPPAIVYFPEQGLDHYVNLANFNEAIRLLYSNNE